MNTDALVASLARFPSVLHALLDGISHDDARFRPDDGRWSILEVVNHLADEEEADFPARLRQTLERPGEQWAPIDPEGWARDRRYNERELDESLRRFADLRNQSIRWLSSANLDDLDRVYEHPSLGSISAGDLLGAWAAHDLLHLRQVTRRLYELANRAAEPWSTAYAGRWP